MSDKAQNNFGTFRIPFTQPQTVTDFQVGPGQYSLSTQSNIPYVSLLGNQGREKIFSWGELIEVPDGMLVSVKNASYHAGSIVLNGGRDFSTTPARITVPVPLTTVSSETDTVGTPEYPADVRRARRAWIVVDGFTGDSAASTAEKTGFIVEGSHNTARAAVGEASVAGVGYSTVDPLPGLTRVDYIALGARTFANDNRVMALLDTARFEITLSGIGRNFESQAYYVMEY